MKRLISFIRNNKEVYWNLTMNDFKARYIGSYLGVIWGVIQPLVTILVYWFVFSVGLRSGDRPDGTPYIVWLIIGMVPWFFISEAISSATNAFLDYSYLVKKVQMRIGMLPFIKIGSAGIIHLFFVTITTIILNFYGYQANWYYFQVIYYIIASVFLAVGISLITASLSVFLRDASQVVSIFIQIGFWAIPIVWGTEVLNDKFRIIFELNPIYYLIEGFRDTFIRNIPFWSHPVLTIYYWGVSIIIFSIGCKIFRKLKPYFADVL